jgi:hypothetical protein
MSVGGDGRRDMRPPQHNAIRRISIPEIGCLAARPALFLIAAEAEWANCWSIPQVGNCPPRLRRASRTDVLGDKQGPLITCQFCDFSAQTVIKYD